MKKQTTMKFLCSKHSQSAYRPVFLYLPYKGELVSQNSATKQEGKYFQKCNMCVCVCVCVHNILFNFSNLYAFLETTINPVKIQSPAYSHVIKMFL
jgi:hypothetical protein